MTPEQVFETGEKEVARIKSEMETIIKSLNFKSSFADFIAYYHFRFNFVLLH